MRGALKYKKKKGLDDTKPHVIVCDDCGEETLCRRVFRRNHGEKRFDVFSVCYTCIPQGNLPGVITKTVLPSGGTMMKVEQILKDMMGKLENINFKVNRVEKSVCKASFEEEAKELRKINRSTHEKVVLLAKKKSRVNRIKEEFIGAGFKIKNDPENHSLKVIKTINGKVRIVGRIGAENGEILKRVRKNGTTRFIKSNVGSVISKFKDK